MSQFNPPTPPLTSTDVTKKKKPIYKRKWFLALAVLMIIGYFAPDFSETDSGESKAPVTTVLATTTLPEKVWSENLKSAVLATDLASTTCAELKKVIKDQIKLIDSRIAASEKPYKDPYDSAEYIQKIDWKTVVHKEVVLSLKRGVTDPVLTSGSITIPLESQYIGFERDSVTACGLSQESEVLKDLAFKLDQRILNMKSSANNLPWYPKGFFQYGGDPQIAYRWLTYGSEYTCSYSSAYCFGMFVIARDGCPTSVYAEINLLDGSDTNLGFTNDTTSALSPGQKAKLVFDTFTDGVKSANLGKISCY